MTHIIPLLVFSLTVSCATQIFAQSKQPKDRPKAERNTSAALTGCIDEQEGRYVLLDDRTMNAVADLDADGVPTEAMFARHVGHKVTVRGSSTPGGTRPVFKVREITTVSDMCATGAPQ
ncbi:MAG: hypothetical protein C5B51_14305 [Terriglobia bacterium]|nr:MAG: hypothetical protein C5B51_14305 [Terriglobia bacterium]